MALHPLSPRPPGRRQTHGLALPIILVAVLVIGLIMFAFSRSSRNELNLLDKMISAQKLIYLVRTGMGIAETKLAKERWYGDTQPRDVIIPTLDDPESSLKIYVDDYVQVVARRYEKVYRMLDHVKIFVEARFRGNVMYGFGKFILSPEPVFDGKSTIGVTGARKTIQVNGEDKGIVAAEQAPTLRRIVGMKFLHEEEIYTAVPTFAGMDDVDSRRALGRFWAGDQIPYARMYGRNLTLSEKLWNADVQFPATASGTVEVEDCRATLQRLDVPPPALSTLETTPSENILKNTFVGETLKRFFLSTAWDVTRARRDDELKKVQIYIPYLPAKCTHPDVIKAIGIAFGANHPIFVREGIDYIPTFTYDLTTRKGAADQYLAQRGFGHSYPDINPTQFSETLSQIKTANAYKFKWDATLVRTGENPGTSVETGDITDAGRCIFLFNNIGNAIESNASFTITVDNVNIIPVSGPDPYYSDYYIREPGTPKNYPLCTILNFFLKYLDDNLVELPPNKNTGYTNPPDSDLVVDPFVEGGDTYVVLF